MARTPEAEPGSGAAGLFAADEEVGRDLGEVDWADTPLGPPGSWPQSLQTAVDILLSSRFAMWMAWGAQLTFFCNAAYRRDTLGRKYPWALGRPASEVWAEIWDDIGPRIGTVLATGRATWDEALLLFLERSAYPEETYHTFSYSPLRDDAGAVVGMLCVVSEDTKRVIGERRMATLRDLGSDPSVVRTEQETLGFAGRQLDRNRQDLPFTLTYLFGDDGTTARLAGSTGIAAGHPAAPAALAADDPDPVWPVAALRRGESALVGLADARTRQPGDHRAMVQQRQPRHHRMAPALPRPGRLSRSDATPSQSRRSATSRRVAFTCRRSLASCSRLGGSSFTAPTTRSTPAASMAPSGPKASPSRVGSFTACVGSGGAPGRASKTCNWAEFEPISKTPSNISPSYPSSRGSCARQANPRRATRGARGVRTAR